MKTDQMAALARTFEQVKSVLDNLPMAVTELDRDRRILFANKTALDWRGFTPEQILGKSARDVLGPDALAFHEPFCTMALGGTAVTGRNDIETPNGKRRVMEFTHNPRFGPDGTVVGDFTYASDVTDSVALEHQLRQSEKLGAIGQLTGGIAHDFNNRLSIILGNAELLGELLARDDECQTMLGEIVAAVGRGSALTRRLLAFARQQTLAPDKQDVNAIVVGMTAMLKRAIAVRVRLELDLAPDLGTPLVDGHQIENALLNLAVNVRDAMPEGGSLTIRTSNVRLDEGPIASREPVRPGAYVCL